jgi:hypothetical protein
MQVSTLAYAAVKFFPLLHMVKQNLLHMVGVRPTTHAVSTYNILPDTRGAQPVTKTPQTIDPAALRNLIAAAKAIVFACEIGRIGCGNEFEILKRKETRSVRNL